MRKLHISLYIGFGAVMLPILLFAFTHPYVDQLAILKSNELPNEVFEIEQKEQSLNKNHHGADLKILVLTYNRAQSLVKCLESLQDLHLDGDSAVLEIWIDRSKSRTVDERVVNVSKTFQWKHGTTSVHIQEQHVGIYGQWIKTWNPTKDGKEIALILEDDIDVSPYAYRWLREAHNHYDKDGDVAGFGLRETELPLPNYKGLLKPSSKEPVFKFPRFCTFGFSPKTDVWLKFQLWYEEKSQNSSFQPYTDSDRIFTNWYKIFQRQHKADSMWSMWFIKFCDEQNLYTVYPNGQQYLSTYYTERKTDTQLAFHRREKGLHFSSIQTTKSSEKFLLKVWYPELVDFPNITTIYDMSGKPRP